MRRSFGRKNKASTAPPSSSSPSSASSNPSSSEQPHPLPPPPDGKFPPSLRAMSGYYGGRPTPQPPHHQTPPHPQQTPPSASHASSSGSDGAVRWTAQSVAQLPPPGLGGPTQVAFAPGSSRYLAYVSGATPSTRPIKCPPSLYRPLTSSSSSATPTTTTSPIPPSHPYPGATPPPVAAPTPATSSSSTPLSATTSSSPGERVLLCLDLEHIEATTSRGGTGGPTPPWLPSQVRSWARPLLRLEAAQPPSAAQPVPSATSGAAAASSSHTTPADTSSDHNDDSFGSSAHSQLQQHQSHASPSNRAVKRRVADTLHTTTQQHQSSVPAGAALTPPNAAATVTTTTTAAATEDLEERLRRERQRLSCGVTQYHWAWADQSAATTPPLEPPPPPDAHLVSHPHRPHDSHPRHPNPHPRHHLRVLIPTRGSLLVQDGVLDQLAPPAPLSPPGSMAAMGPAARCMHKQAKSPIDPQLSPDGSMVAWSCDGEVYVKAAGGAPLAPPIRLSFGADPGNGLSHGIAEFVAQEEMDRYRGFWWHPDGSGILLTRVDESPVPVFRIVHHQGSASSATATAPPASLNGGGAAEPTSSGSTPADAEDHRYPFAGKANPVVRLGFVPIDRASILQAAGTAPTSTTPTTTSSGVGVGCFGGAMPMATSAAEWAQDVAAAHWRDRVAWFEPPREASEYLCRVYWLEDGNAVSLWQNRGQTALVLQRLDLATHKGRTLWIERSEHWINLHHMFYVLPPMHPRDCRVDDHAARFGDQYPLPADFPPGSFSFLLASERTGYSHLYLYTYVPGINGDLAVPIRTVSCGNWMVEQIVGANVDADWVYVTGTYDSPLERHMYALPITGRASSEAGPAYEATVPDVVMTSSNSPAFGDIRTHNMVCDEPVASAPLHPPPPPPPPQSGQSPQLSLLHSPTNGVRRSLSKVMNALSGKAGSQPGPAASTGGAHTASSSFRASEADAAPWHTSSNGTHAHPAPTAFAAAAAAASAASGRPVRLTLESGMHSVVMDDACRYFVDTSSDLDRPTSVKLFELGCSSDGLLLPPRLVLTLFDAAREDAALARLAVPVSHSTNPGRGGRGPSASVVDVAYAGLPAPEILQFPTSDGAETLFAALYRPDATIYGPGPHPLICAVYGGPHVQRVNRSWSQCADMRAQRLRSLGFCVVKCDNRGSSRRGVAFETAISRRLGRIEVLDQVAAVRQLILRGLADPHRVGVYGWSYGGYLAAMCLCRAPDVFQVAVAGAPVTSWDGYDTHYTERYMGLPADNAGGYRESSVFEHVPNMRGRLLLVHGLIDENVHFRHTTRLINKLIASGKDYELLIFPEERHSPRRLRDRVYMEQRISDFFARHLQAVVAAPNNPGDTNNNIDLIDVLSQGGLPGLRAMAGRL